MTTARVKLIARAMHAAVQSLTEQHDIAHEMLGLHREEFKAELVRMAFYT